MKKHIFQTGMMMLALLYFGCGEEGVFDKAPNISPNIIKLIADHGFSTEGVLEVEDGYLVEGDIFLTEEQLLSTPIHFRVPSEEQYHTFNLVSAVPRTLTVGFDKKVDQSIVDATLDAMARYNNENLAIDFAVAGAGNNSNGGGNGSGGSADMGPPGGNPGNGGGNGGGGNGGGGTSADIVISKAPKNASYLASAGFPTTGGDPHNNIKVNQNFLLANSWDYETVVSIMAHEIGHCIGFRHTDWYERQISCGGSPGQYEGQENSGVGAVHIPGTPTQNQNVDGNSFMLSCIGNGIDRPFSNDDKTALNCLYDTSTPCTN